MNIILTEQDIIKSIKSNIHTWYSYNFKLCLASYPLIFTFVGMKDNECITRENLYKYNINVDFVDCTCRHDALNTKNIVDAIFDSLSHKTISEIKKHNTKIRINKFLGFNLFS